MGWNKELFVKNQPKLNKPILIEGLPGIGNVGKIVVDFIIEELKAKKLMEFSSYTFPHSVFVNEKNLVELPKIEMFYKKNEKGSDFLFLAGDVQPTEEVPSYEFSQMIIDIVKEYRGKEIITIGGIGLSEIPEVPKIYATANDKEFLKKFKKDTSLSNNLYGLVGPIIGVTGLLVGLSKKHGIPAICLLSETFGHPMYLGIKGAREILKILNKKFNLKLDLKKLDKEIKEIEGDMKKTEDFASVSRGKKGFVKSTDYIG